MNTVTFVAAKEWMPPFSLDFRKNPKKLSDEEFFLLCQNNRDLRIERTKFGGIEIMAPAYTETGHQNFKLNAKFGVWVEKDGTGIGFDSSAGFTLPNGAVRSPDFSWMTLKKFKSISKEDRERFARVCPDFVVELRSKTDALKKLRAKMEEYIENGASLGWLIDPVAKKVYIYMPNAKVEILNDPKEISGGELLKDFKLRMKEIWG